MHAVFDDLVPFRDLLMVYDFKKNLQKLKSMLNLQLSPRKPLNFAYSRLIFVQDAWIVELRQKMAFLIPLVVGSRSLPKQS